MRIRLKIPFHAAKLHLYDQIYLLKNMLKNIFLCIVAYIVDIQ